MKIKEYMTKQSNLLGEKYIHIYIYIYRYNKKTYAVIWSVKVIHSGQSSNVNILCMRHTLNGLKFVHENKYIINISDNLQRKDI